MEEIGQQSSGVFTNLLRSRPNYELRNVTTVLASCLTLVHAGHEAHFKGKELHLFLQRTGCDLWGLLNNMAFMQMD